MEEEKGDISPVTAIVECKEEILEHVRALASGRVNVVYPIVAAGKQLLELEKSVETAKEDF